MEPPLNTTSEDGDAMAVGSLEVPCTHVPPRGTVVVSVLFLYMAVRSFCHLVRPILLVSVHVSWTLKKASFRAPPSVGSHLKPNGHMPSDGARQKKTGSRVLQGGTALLLGGRLP